VLATYFGRVGDGTPKAGGDAHDARLVDVAELADLPMTQGTRHVIEEARRLLAAEPQ
jgi:hypothetical protein